MVCKGYEPEKVLEYFEKLSTIPRGSGNEKAVSDYLVSFAKERGLYVRQDEANNVVIKKKAYKGYESHPGVIIQGHMDMVAVKDKDFDIDLEKDPLRLKIKDGFLFAEGTTLGSDDGIAVAYALAILDSDDIIHPPLTVIITTDEEVGMNGASYIDLSDVDARILLNVDSEEEGILTVGCAGGARADSVFPVVRECVKGDLLRIELTGLLGGHSGEEINKKRGNASVLMARFLTELADITEYSLFSLMGGDKDNAITSESVAEIVVSGDDGEVSRFALEFEKIIKEEYRKTDPDMKLGVYITKDVSVKALSFEDSVKMCNTIYIMPNGIQEMSADIEGLVETSLNLGIVKLEEDRLLLGQSLRSSVSSRKEALKRKVAKVTQLAGGEISFRGEYPAWEYNKDSRLRDLMIEIFRKEYGKEPEVKMIHAGLECGILAKKLEGLDAVSFGPDLKDIHTTREKMDLKSCERTYNYILEILKSL